MSRSEREFATDFRRAARRSAVSSTSVTRCFADALSGQPWHPAAIHAVRSATQSSWADPAANYTEAGIARTLLDASRVTVANALGVEPDQVVFRRSGADAAELAVGITVAEAAAQPAATSQVAALASAVERRVVLEALEGHCQLRLLPVDSTARAITDPLDFRDHRDYRVPQAPERNEISAIQAANIELGTLQPLTELLESNMDRPDRSPALIDATGALGLVPIPRLWTTLVADAAGWAGPREAAVVIGPADRLRPVPDSLGLPSIIATAAALDAVCREAPTQVPRLRGMADRVREVVRNLPGAVLLGPERADQRLPHVIAFLARELDVLWLQAELDRAGVSVGSGSACSDRYGRASHVLEAAGHPTKGSIRICLPWGTTDDQLEHLLIELPAAVTRLRRQMGLDPNTG